MKFTSSALFLALASFVLFSSCKKEKPKPTDIDLAAARITDFQVQETAYSTINIIHPVIQDGVEIQMGEIELVLPKGTTQLQLTPKTSNFSKAGFTVSPALGVKQNFLGRTVIYKIASTRDASKAVHYHVRIREEDEAATGNIQVTGFSFLKAKNPALPTDIESARIIHRPGNMGYIFVFVPEGTDFTSLTPTISHTGTGLFYSQDPSASPATATTAYPAAGAAIDFAYPKVFYAVVKQGSETQVYNVIVDVRNPVQFSQAAVTTPNVKAGSNQVVEATTFVNRGNHPISIIGVDHSQQVPAGLNAIRGIAAVPSSGLLPGKSSEVKASVNAQTYPAGTYEVRASFKPRLTDYWEADNLLQPTQLHITTTIVN
jgi:hypothetical protein